jgi:hypothetical protein
MFSVINRFFSLILAILIFIGFEVLFKKPDWIYFLILYFIFVTAALIWQAIGKGLITFGARWKFLITPLSLVLSGLFFIIFLENLFLKHFLAILISILVGFFLENIIIYIYFHERYQASSLENISNYLNLISIFFFTSSIFGVFSFLNISLWLLTILILVIVALLIYETMWINKFFSFKKWIYILVISLISVETFWAVTFLPVSFYVSGAILTIVYYILSGLSRNYLLGILDKRILKRYLIVSIIVLILILGTAKWG